MQGLEAEKRGIAEMLSQCHSECKSLMEDYQSCAAEQRRANDKCQWLQNQVDAGQRELAERADGMRQLEEHSKELEEERNQAVEKMERKELQVQLCPIALHGCSLVHVPLVKAVEFTGSIYQLPKDKKERLPPQNHM